MNVNPLISIIIPVYKVESYLSECLDSVIAQTYTNLQIILVDDGSPDNCGAICDEYAARNERIVVIHKPNGGLSDARNAGMKLIKGECIYFMDSDDRITSTTIASLMEKMQTYNADIVCGRTCSFTTELPSMDIITDPDTVYDRKNAVLYAVNKDWSAWGKLYRREIHEGIEFPYGKIHEDEAIMFRLLERCQRVVYTSDGVYCYRQREGSITAEAYSLRKMDWFYHWAENTDFIADKYPEALGGCLDKTLTTALYNLGHLAGKEEYAVHLKAIKDYVKKHITTILFSANISITKKVRVISMMLSHLERENCFYLILYRKMLKR